MYFKSDEEKKLEELNTNTLFGRQLDEMLYRIKYLYPIGNIKPNMELELRRAQKELRKK